MTRNFKQKQKKQEKRRKSKFLHNTAYTQRNNQKQHYQEQLQDYKLQQQELEMH
jgi:hypothetical protein